jgi:hypothetical protein
MRNAVSQCARQILRQTGHDVDNHLWMSVNVLNQIKGQIRDELVDHVWWRVRTQILAAQPIAEIIDGVKGPL